MCGPGEFELAGGLECVLSVTMSGALGLVLDECCVHVMHSVVTCPFLRRAVGAVRRGGAGDAVGQEPDA